jgi:hypothetical protein
MDDASLLAAAWSGFAGIGASGSDDDSAEARYVGVVAGAWPQASAGAARARATRKQDLLGRKMRPEFEGPDRFAKIILCVVGSSGNPKGWAGTSRIGRRLDTWWSWQRRREAESLCGLIFKKPTLLYPTPLVSPELSHGR